MRKKRIRLLNHFIKNKTVFTPQQNREAGDEINNRLKMVTISWSTELRAWHGTAMKALKFASNASLEVSQSNYRKLLEVDKRGVNANVVAILCNNIERRSPDQMGMTTEQWCDFLELNQRVADTWESFCSPIREKVIEEIKKKYNIDGKILTMDTKSN